MHAFTDLATAAYCPRKLYYRWRDDDYDLPDRVEAVRRLAYRYEESLEDEVSLRDEPIAVTPTQYRANLGSAKARIDCWEDLADPPARDVLLEGRDCRGIAHKLVGDPVVPTVVSTGEPPDRGVWEPQSVRATAAAKALSWERERTVDRAFVEYAAHGVIREVAMTTRRKASYRRALRTVQAVDGPPPRLRDDARCTACEYQPRCGTKTRSLRSRLSL